jgi:hypothetical protein
MPGVTHTFEDELRNPVPSSKDPACAEHGPVGSEPAMREADGSTARAAVQAHRAKRAQPRHPDGSGRFRKR